ncbi:MULTISPECIES: hypothetical protein [unclassified Moorena]|uniref:hypothetical protein n=1 Tax=unclassified Moorena TaxID=2683338 RepID=UPI0014012059|nr:MULTISPECIES: hypothetical protein [unclassified Moorena]NEO15296.1 hypothetical protein [Moorena sp. SIO3E8]NEQ01698.1 hypothetical protein [Moorena sp. SIO3F7]
MLPCKRQQTRDNQDFFPTPYSLLPTPYSLLPTPYSLLPTPYSLLPTPQNYVLNKIPNCYILKRLLLI